MARIFADDAYRPGFNFLGDRRAVRKAPSVSYIESIVRTSRRTVRSSKGRGGRTSSLRATARCTGWAT